MPDDFGGLVNCLTVTPEPCGGVTTGKPHRRGTCAGCDRWNWNNPNWLGNLLSPEQSRVLFEGGYSPEEAREIAGGGDA